MKLEQDVSTVAGLRALIASPDKMEVPDSATVKGSGLRGGRIVLTVEVEPVEAS